MDYKLYPAFLHLNKKNVLLIGGGNVAWEKLPNLAQTGAKLTVISKEFNSRVQEFLKKNPNIEVQEREIRFSDLEGRDLIFSATNNRLLNRDLVDEARKLGIWINSCDDPENCDFFSSAVFDRGPIRIAVSTQGKFAGLGGLLKEVLSELIPEQHTEEIEEIMAIRSELKKRIGDPSDRKKILLGIIADLKNKYFQTQPEIPG
jgi:precorrin-2 dehydrogenase/sirohydrochlorin ferrochelatase